MTKLSDNLTPSLLLVEQDDTAVVAPAAGNQRLFIDEADHLLYLKDENGDVAAAGGDGGIADQGAFTYLDATDAAAPADPASGYARIYSKAGRIYSRDSGGTEYGPFEAAGGGGGLTGAYFARVQTGASSTVTLPEAPEDGVVFLFCNFSANGTGASAVSSTNTTWTKVHGPYTSGTSRMETWCGVVSGTGGTGITVTNGYSYNSTSAMVLQGVTLTPTAGAQLAEEATAGTHTLTGVTPGSLVVGFVTNQNTGNGASITDVTPNGVVFRGDAIAQYVVPCFATYATGTTVAVTCAAASAVLMSEIT